MHLDVFTAVVVAGISSFIMSLAMLAAARSYATRVPGMNNWVWACASQTIGWLMIALRGVIPDWLSIYGGNLILAGSFLNYFFSLKEFREQPYHKWRWYLLLPVLLLLFIYFTEIKPDIAIRTDIIGVIAFIISVACTRLLLERDHGSLPFSHWFAACVFSLSALVSIGRVAYLVFVAPPMSSVFARNPATDIILIWCCLQVCLLTFSFMLMCNDKASADLSQAIREIKTLTGLLPICSQCKMIRDDEGSWRQVEAYVQEHSDAEFSHSICPDCIERLYPGLLTAPPTNDNYLTRKA